MKCQSLFSEKKRKKKKKNNSKCCLLKFLPGVLSIKMLDTLTLKVTARSEADAIKKKNKIKNK